MKLIQYVSSVEGLYEELYYDKKENQIFLILYIRKFRVEKLQSQERAA
jgi:hypothetical protein